MNIEPIYKEIAVMHATLDKLSILVKHLEWENALYSSTLDSRDNNIRTLREVNQNLIRENRYLRSK